MKRGQENGAVGKMDGRGQVFSSTPLPADGTLCPRLSDVKFPLSTACEFPVGKYEMYMLEFGRWRCFVRPRCEAPSPPLLTSQET